MSNSLEVYWNCSVSTRRVNTGLHKCLPCASHLYSLPSELRRSRTRHVHPDNEPLHVELFNDAVRKSSFSLQQISCKCKQAFRHLNREFVGLFSLLFLSALWFQDNIAYRQLKNAPSLYWKSLFHWHLRHRRETSLYMCKLPHLFGGRVLWMRKDWILSLETSCKSNL